MTFPQFFDGNELQLNIVVLPRDHNPLNPIIINGAPPNPGDPPIPDAEEAFADATFSFNAHMLPGLGINPLPQPQPAANGIALTTSAPENPRDIFEAMGQHLNIFQADMDNSNVTLSSIPSERQFEKTRKREHSVSKYLPKSYRGAFNFTGPRTKNAVTDDSYHCAVKAAKYHANFKRSSEIVSWGKVFAHIMRQPLLAQQAGFIYSTSLPIDANSFPDGGYLYIDLADGSSYSPQTIDPDFIKRYAARIPALTPGEPRHVFAPLLYPVLSSHDGNYDDLFLETAELDDGFAKIVHCHQPPHRDPMVEEADGSYPTKEGGVYLGWMDQKILMWYMRQLMEDNSVADTSKRLDAPLGVLGYNIDVREIADPGDPDNPWESLNRAISKQSLSLARDPQNPGDFIDLGTFDGELPYQVYPMQLDGTEQVTGVPQTYWLPMYFANWNGHSMVLPNEEAAQIYQNTNAALDGDPEGVLLTDEDGNPVLDKDGNQLTTGTGVTGPAQNQLNQMYNAGAVNTLLRYGNSYQFRVRMQDISGGSPNIDLNPLNETPSDIATCAFKRFVNPIQPRIQELEALQTDDDTVKHPILSKDGPSELTELNIRRPKLSYPAVVYTGKYSDPIQRLMNQSNLGLQTDLSNAEHRVGLGIADPDVNAIEITVEIASLKLDKLDSVNGKEDYVHLYTTKRSFPDLGGNEDNYEAVLNIPINYVDIQGTDKVLNTGIELSLVEDLGLTDDIDNLSELVLPTAREARLTIRAVCEDKETENETGAYYGVIDEANKSLDVRYGEAFTMKLYKPSDDETSLLVQTPGVPELQGIFMRPDLQPAFDGKLTTFLLGKQNFTSLSNVQQFAERLQLENSGLTLNAGKGKRIVFGCSSRIRHTLAPDGSSLTLASKGDLMNHWLCCLSLEIDRDWMWDALETDSFIVKRTHGFTYAEQPEAVDAEVGRIKMIRTASFEALDGPQRNSTRLLFIDAIEPKKEPQGNAPAFPDTIDVSYTFEPQFKAEHAAQSDEPIGLSMTLPITTPPAQIPKIASAGLALSPYQRDEKYSSSESRKRFLWVEFDAPIQDPQDTYFARVLVNTPDQLISNNHPSLFIAPEEPELPIDPELMRVISPASSNDLAGLNAMQPMIKSANSEVHYLLPMPPGLHANSDEMFGFFTYEFRVGHFERPPENPEDAAEKVWTTAQGRFGRRLKSNGIQHPAPGLNCMPNRDEDKLWVTAPYAVAVHQGKNVTADPPRTELWALLYAQVKQADNKDYRNVLLDDRPLDWRVQVETEKEVNVFEKYSEGQLKLLNNITQKTLKGQASITPTGNFLKLVDLSINKNKKSTKYGTTVWSNAEIRQLLAACGLPKDSPLSTVVVEILPQIQNIFDHISELEKPSVVQNAVGLVDSKDIGNFAKEYSKKYGKRGETVSAAAPPKPSPLSDRLGHHRILRTSPLTRVPDICCDSC